MFARFFKKKQKEEPPPKDYWSVDPTNGQAYFHAKNRKNDVVESKAFLVTDFSSQYGGETSMSYTACNLAGRGNIYPNYGDYTQACVFRIYGPWWDMAPSRMAPFKRTPPTFCSQDYIELYFQGKCFPTKLAIYETYNPGCVVKVLACENSDDTDVDTGRKLTRWKTLWEGEPVICEPSSRKFCPHLQPCPFPTNLIRLELCHKLVNYYTELDFVELTGKPVHDDNQESNCDDSSDSLGDTQNPVSIVMKDMEGLSINTKSESPVKEQDEITVTTDKGHGEQSQILDQGQVSAQGQFSAQGESLAQGHECYELGNVQNNEKEETNSDNGYFDLLPEEVIQLILSFLDVLSLCRVARTSRLLYKHSYDSLQYTELNLQPHWPQVNNIALESLHSRSRFLQRLNLSWCHQNIVSETAFCRYIENCGKTLRDLYLSSCNFVTAESIHHIAKYCPNLKELDISSCKEIDTDGFYDISDLTHIERLNLYRTNIEQPELLRIVRSCPELQHLNLGSVRYINNMDEILQVLAENARNLKSLDLWRCQSVTGVGVTALARCTQLEELDIGWCSNVKSSSQCIQEIIHCCLNLKKLFLTANRSVCDSDILAVADYSKQMEQLDILGTRLVSADTAQMVLEKCEKLKFFDVSFCSGIDNYIVNFWKRKYPHVAFKKSSQNPD